MNPFVVGSCGKKRAIRGASFAAVCWLAAALATIGSAIADEAPNREFKPGDRVVIKLANSTRPGEIIRKVVTNIYEVRMLDKDPPEIRNWPVAFLLPETAAPPIATTPKPNVPAPPATPTTPVAPVLPTTPTTPPKPTTPAPRIPDSESRATVTTPPTPAVPTTPATPPQNDPQKPAARIWKDSTGQFNIEATLAEFTNGQVVLKRTDGRTVTLPLERLSEDDQRFVRQLSTPVPAASNPFDEFAVPPARPANSTVAESKPVTPVPAVEITPETPKPAAGGIRLTQPDWSAVQEIATGGEAPPWAVAADSAAALPALTARPVALTKQDDSAAKLLAVLFAADKHEMLVAWGHTDPRKETETRLEWYDLKQARRLRSFTGPPRIIPLAIHPNGSTLLTMSREVGTGESNRLDVWQVAGGRLESVQHFAPYAKESVSDRDIQWADWVDERHVLSLSRGNQLVLWELPAVSAIYSIQLVQACRPALSPGRKQLAVVTAAGTEIYDSLTGQLLGRLGNEAGMFPRLAFRPDGRQLAAVSSYRLEVWDVDSGTKFRDIPTTPSGDNARVLWLDDNYLLIDAAYLRLVDLERRIVLWDFVRGGLGDKSVFNARAGCFWYPGEDSARRLGVYVPIRLPHDEARQVAAGLDPNAILAVRPGQSVSLEMNIDAPPEMQEELRRAIVDKLTKNGLRVSDGQPLTLVARTGQGRSYDVRYFGFGAAGSSTVNVTEQTSELEFVLDGQTVWKAMTVAGPPYRVSLKEGQSIDQAVSENTKPRLDFFRQAHLPTHIVRPIDKPAYGRSFLTPQGSARPLQER
jgi:hypothetical protein